MAAFNKIKLSYKIDNVTITRSIPNYLFNELYKEECKDLSLSDYEALISVIYTLVGKLANDKYVQFIECEYVDQFGFKVTIVR